MASNQTNAGLGADLHISGLDDLIKANKLFEEITQKAKSLNTTSNSHVNINVHGMDDIQKVHKMASDLNKNIDTNVNVHVNNNNAINMTQNEVQRLKQRMEELGPAGKKGTDSQKDLHEAIKNNSEALKGFKSSIDKAFNSSDEKAKHTTKHLDHFKSIFAGSFLGNAMSNASGNMEGLAKQAYSAAQGAAGFNKQWMNIGVGQQGATELMGQVSQIRGMSDMAAGDINKLQRNFYNLTGNVGQTKELTSAVAAFGKAGGSSAEQMQRASKMIPQMLAQKQDKSINGGMFNRMFGQLPKLKNAVVQYSGMTSQSFNQALQKGKITGNQLEGYMQNASKHSSDAWKQFNSTMGGEMAALRGTWKNALSSFGKPFFAAITGAFGSINRNGKVVGNVQSQVMSLSKSIGTTLGNALGKMLKWLSKNGNSLMKFGKSIFSIAKSIGTGIFKSIAVPLKLVTGHANGASRGIKGIANATQSLAKHKNMLKGIGVTIASIFAATKVVKFVKWIVSAYKAFKEFYGIIKASKTIIAIVHGISAAFKLLSLSNPFGWIVLGVGAAVAALWALWHWRKPIGKFFKGIGNWAKQTFIKLGKWAKNVVNSIVSAFNSLKNKLSSVVRSIGNVLDTKFGSFGKDLVKYFKDAFKTIKDIFHGFADFFSGDWGDFFKKDIPKLLGDLGNLAKDGIKGLWDGITGIVKSAASKLWQGLKDDASNGINGVIKVINLGIKGIDWAVNKLGGKKQVIHPMNEVHFASGTTRRKITRPTLSMLNDGTDSPQTNNKEMALLPNGKAFIPKQRNWKGILPAGTEVLNATETRLLMAIHGIKHFSLGTGIGNAFDWIKDKAESISNVVAHPIKYLTSIMHLPKQAGVFGQFLTGSFDKAKSAAKGFLGKMIDSMSNINAGGDAKKWKPIIERAASMMHIGALSGEDLGKIIGSIERESSGNAKAHQQVQDVNSAAGHPAQGLLQFIPSTFAKYAVKGHKNILNGLDSIMAMFNDSTWREDMHGGNGGWGPTGTPKYKNGGRPTPNKPSLVGENGPEMFVPDKSGMIIPHENTKKVMNGNNHHISINSNPTFNINSDRGVNRGDIQKQIEQYNNDLADKIAARLGGA